MRVESNLFFMILKFNFDCFSFSFYEMFSLKIRSESRMM